VSDALTKMTACLDALRIHLNSLIIDELVVRLAD
jgi:hypothetical protein